VSDENAALARRVVEIFGLGGARELLGLDRASARAPLLLHDFGQGSNDQGYAFRKYD